MVVVHVKLEQFVTPGTMSTSTRLISAALTCCWARRYVFLKESWGFRSFPKTYRRRQKGGHEGMEALEIT